MRYDWHILTSMAHQSLEHWPVELTCKKVESFCGQNLDFQKFPQKCVTCSTPNFAIYGMICKLEEEMTTNQAGIDLSETPIEVFMKRSC